MEKLKDWHIIIVLAALGFVLRIYFLSYQSIWIDEAFSINAAKAILFRGYPLLQSGLLYSGYLLHTYLTAAFFKIGGLFGARLISVIFGVLLIPATFLLAKEVFDRKVGLLSAALVAFSYIFVSWSRQARMYMMFTFFFIFSLYLLLKYTEKPDLKNTLLLAGATICAILSHTYGLLLIPIYLAYFLIQRDKKFKPAIIKLIILCAAGLVYFIYQLSIGYQLPKVFAYLVSYFNFLSHSHTAVFLLGIIGLGFALFSNKKVWLLLLATVIPLAFFSFFVILRHFRYLIIILPLLYILAASLAFELTEMHSYGKYQKLAALLILALFIAALFTEGFVFIPQKTYYLETETPQPDFNAAYSWIKQQDYDILITDYPAVAQYYAVYPDYGINFSMSGLSFELNRTADVYTNTTLIHNHIDFERIIANRTAIVIIDKLSQRRMNQDLLNYIKKNMTRVSEASSVTNAYSGVDVYAKK